MIVLQMKCKAVHAKLERVTKAKFHFPSKYLCCFNKTMIWILFNSILYEYKIILVLHYFVNNLIVSLKRKYISVASAKTLFS